MNIPNIQSYIQALKLTWLRRTLSENGRKWKTILIKQAPEIENINKFGPSILTNNKVNPFWKDVFKSYEDLHVKHKPNTSEELLAESLFLNEKNKIGDKTFNFQDWVDNGILTVRSLVKENGSFMSINEMGKKNILSQDL